MSLNTLMSVSLFMTNLRVNLSEEIDKEFRSMVASKYGYSKGVLSYAIQDAVLKWIIKNGKEPWLYIDSSMCFDIKDELYIQFLEILFNYINVDTIDVSFEATSEEINLINSFLTNFEIKGKDLTFHVNKSDFIKTIKQLFTILQIHLKYSLLIEFGDAYIIGGGGGCFNIEGNIPMATFNQIVMEFLKALKIEIQPNLKMLKDYQLILLNPDSKLIILTEKG